MFALILWVSAKPRSFSVVPVSAIRKHSRGQTLVRWGHRWYPARIIKKSSHREELESLEISIDGEILPSPCATGPIAEARLINEENLSFSPPATDGNVETVSDVLDDAPEKQKSEESRSSLDEDSIEGAQVEDRQLDEPDVAGPLADDDVAVANTDGSRIELLPQSGVFISQEQLDKILQTSSTDSKQMCRRLMHIIVGKGNLVNMTPTGKGGFISIPKNVVDTVEQYVNSNVEDPHVDAPQRLSRPQYMRVLTLMCNTLRNPKPYSRKK